MSLFSSVYVLRDMLSFADYMPESSKPKAKEAASKRGAAKVELLCNSSYNNSFFFFTWIL